MNKIKKATLSVILALLLVIIINYIYFGAIKTSYVSALILLEDVDKGKIVTEGKVKQIKIKKDTIANEVDINGYNVISLENIVLNQNMRKGQILTNDVLMKASDHLVLEEQYESMAIPINSASNIVGYQVKKGDFVNIYYTAKTKDIPNISEKFLKVYTTNNIEGSVTLKIYSSVEVIATYDNSGKQTKAGEASTQIIIRVKKEDALTLVALKSQGTFDVSLVK